MYASVTFGLGSFMLFTDGAVHVLFHSAFWPMGRSFPSIVGYCGILLWTVGIALLVWARLEPSPKEGWKARPVFLRGRTCFRCRSCGANIKASKHAYHERKRCRCGIVYDLFQDGPWDVEEGGRIMARRP